MLSNLAQHQKVAYRVLTNAIQNQQLSHAYLFVGERGTYKKEMALFLAQSLVCEQDVLACGTCESCRRIASMQYADLLYYDGALQSIKKDDILHIRSQFSKTPLEARGKKIFILNRVENTTAEALNSLLKFLEEPTNDVTAILLVESMDKLLPTIVSRCQVIKFQKGEQQALFERAKANTIDELDAFLLSHQVNSIEQILELQESDAVQTARTLFTQSVPWLRKDPYQALYILQSEGFSKKKQNDQMVMTYYLGMLKTILKYASEQKTSGVDAFDHLLDSLQLRFDEAVRLQIIVLQTKDQIRPSVNVGLLMDSFIYQVKEVLQ